MSILSLLSDLTSFGTAGLMGALWLWERKLNRRREEQLDATHERILRDEQKIACLIDVVDKNTAAIVRFVEHQKEQSRILKHIMEVTNHVRVP